MRQAIEVSFACNNACIFCAQGRLRTSAPAAAISSLKARISALPQGVPVAFVGGEPTLCSELVDLVKLAKQRTDDVLLQTNARLLARTGHAERLAAAGVSALDISLHGSTEAMHDYHTGVAGSFRQTVAGIGRARAARLPFAITTVVTRSNVRHLTQIAQVAHTLGARGVQLVTVECAGRAVENRARLIVAPELRASELSRAASALDRLGLGWLVAERASAPEVRAWFAGIGTREAIAVQPAEIRLPTLESAGPGELTQAGIG